MVKFNAEKFISATCELYEQGRCQLSKSNYEEAEKSFKSILTQAFSGVDLTPMITRDSVKWLVHVYLQQRRFNDIFALYENYITQLEQVHNYEQMIDELCNLAYNYQLQKNYEQVHSVLQRALDIGHKEGLPDKDLVGVLGHMAINFYLSGQYNLAEVTYVEQLAIREKENLLSISFAQDLNTLGAIYEKQHKFGQARDVYKKILTWCDDDPDQRGFMVGMVKAELRAIADKP